MAGSAVGGPVQSIGNAAYFGDALMSPGEYGMGLATGGLLGGAFNGASALLHGRSFLNGYLPRTEVPLAPVPSPMQARLSDVELPSPAGKVPLRGPSPEDYWPGVLNKGPIRLSPGMEVRGAVGGSKYAFGLKNVVPKFADDIGAIHLMKDSNWKSSFMKAINNPNNKLHFNLNGIDSKPMQMIMNPGRSGINWEMNALYQNSAAFQRTIFHYGGNVYKGFDIFKIIP